ncbi:MAG: PorV/PorQ family protein [Elusimicrobiota bacterium]|nr:PorV/PorQ family protein [Elusimicrobiota bacterium]
MKKIITLISAALLPALVFADDGTSGAQFLQIGVGSRASAMGEAFAGIDKDIDSVYWNPAGLNGIDSMQGSFSHAVWLQETSCEHISVVRPVSNAVMGLSLDYTASASMKKYNNSGTLTGSFDSSDMVMTLSAAKNIRYIPLGVNLKFISSSIESESASAIALDIGTMYRIMEGKLNLGLAIQNIGTEMKFIAEADPLPLNIKYGAAYKVNSSLTAVLDINVPNDNDVRANMGVEYAQVFSDKLTSFYRMGYRTDTDGLDNNLAGFSAGIGIDFKSYQFSYAWTPYGDLGTTHRISLSLKL